METRPTCFSHRLHDWRRLAGYNQRQILTCGKRSVLVNYDLSCPEVSGKKILLFSDVHWRDNSSIYQEMIDDVAAYAAKYKPDLVLFNGDLAWGMCFLQESLEALRRIEAPARIAIAGNWERRRYWIPVEQWREYFKIGGFQLIVQEWYQQGDLAIFGTDDLKKGKPEYPADYPEAFRILAAHNPDTVINLGRRDIMRKFKLVLCGHTHGGQIRLPGTGAVMTSSRYGTKLDYGMFHNAATDTTMIITAGMGYTWFQYRLLCQSEAALINFV